jgi:hypothetical protein
LDEEDSIFNRKLSTIYLMKNMLRSVLEEKMERGGFSVYGWGVGKIGSELHFCAKWIESKNRPVNSTEKGIFLEKYQGWLHWLQIDCLLNLI